MEMRVVLMDGRVAFLEITRDINMCLRTVLLGVRVVFMKDMLGFIEYWMCFIS